MTRQAVFRKLDALYERMASVYADTSAKIGLSCEGCEENCCTSYFQHHTYVEWTYLWQGLNKLPEDKRNEYIRRSEIRAQCQCHAGKRHASQDYVSAQ